MEDNCHVERYQKDVNENDLANAQVAYLSVEGMGCARCALRVENGLNRLEGVFEASVSLDQQMAEVYYNPQLLKLDDMVNAVAAAGDAQKHRYRAQIIQQ